MSNGNYHAQFTTQHGYMSRQSSHTNVPTGGYRTQPSQQKQQQHMWSQNAQQNYNAPRTVNEYGNRQAVNDYNRSRNIPEVSVPQEQWQQTQKKQHHVTKQQQQQHVSYGPSSAHKQRSYIKMQNGNTNSEFNQTQPQHRKFRVSKPDVLRWKTFLVPLMYLIVFVIFECIFEYANVTFYGCWLLLSLSVGFVFMEIGLWPQRAYHYMPLLLVWLIWFLLLTSITWKYEHHPDNNIDVSVYGQGYGLNDISDNGGGDCYSEQDDDNDVNEEVVVDSINDDDGSPNNVDNVEPIEGINDSDNDTNHVYKYYLYYLNRPHTVIYVLASLTYIGFAWSTFTKSICANNQLIPILVAALLLLFIFVPFTVPTSVDKMGNITLYKSTRCLQLVMFCLLYFMSNFYTEILTAKNFRHYMPLIKITQSVWPLFVKEWWVIILCGLVQLLCYLKLGLGNWKRIVNASKHAPIVAVHSTLINQMFDIENGELYGKKQDVDSGSESGSETIDASILPPVMPLSKNVTKVATSSKLHRGIEVERRQRQFKTQQQQQQQRKRQTNGIAHVTSVQHKGGNIAYQGSRSNSSAQVLVGAISRKDEENVKSDISDFSTVPKKQLIETSNDNESNDMSISQVIQMKNSNRLSKSTMMSGEMLPDANNVSASVSVKSSSVCISNPTLITAAPVNLTASVENSKLATYLESISGGTNE